MMAFSGDSLLVHPKNTPSGVGIGVRMRDGRPMLWAVSGCCEVSMQRVGDGDGHWELKWFCHGCERTVRKGGVALPVGMPLHPRDAFNTYMSARVWAGDWTGLSRHDVKIKVRW